MLIYNTIYLYRRDYRWIHWKNMSQRALLMYQVTTCLLMTLQNLKAVFLLILPLFEKCIKLSLSKMSVKYVKLNKSIIYDDKLHRNIYLFIIETFYFWIK